MHNFKKNQNIKANTPNISGDKAISIVDKLYKFILKDPKFNIKNKTIYHFRKDN
jgi:ssDNA-specific exonuclease RecJ